MSSLTCAASSERPSACPIISSDSCHVVLYGASGNATTGIPASVSVSYSSWVMPDWVAVTRSGSRRTILSTGTPSAVLKRVGCSAPSMSARASSNQSEDSSSLPAYSILSAPTGTTPSDRG